MSFALLLVLSIFSLFDMLVNLNVGLLRMKGVVSCYGLTLTTSHKVWFFYYYNHYGLELSVFILMTA